MAGGMDEERAPRDGDSKRPKIRFTTPPPVPVESRGYAVFNLDGTAQEVRSSWRATVQAYRLWCFNSTPDRYQFGHPHRRSCMLPLHGHFLVYMHFNGKWLCAVIHGSSRYLDGYITQSTGENLRVRENRPSADQEDAKDEQGPVYIQNADKRAKVEDKKGKVADRGSKFAAKEDEKISGKGANLADKKKTKVVAEGSSMSEEEFGIGLNEELTIIEDIRLFYRADHSWEMFKLNQLPVHLVNGRPENNDLDEYLKPQKPNTDSLFLIKPFRRFVRSYRKKQKDEEKISADLEKTTSDMEHLCADLLDPLPESSNESHNVGIQNLGNTCYASSSLQCLHSVVELKSALYGCPENAEGNVGRFHNLTRATKSLFNELNQSSIPIRPVRFVETLRETFPQFNETEVDERGHARHRQQDAEECLSCLVSALSETLALEPSDLAARPIKELFEIELLMRTKRNHFGENDDETMSTEKRYDLKCHIYEHVKHLREGLELDLNSEHETNSSTGQTVRYTTKSTINKLPCYLVIQFGRVHHKKGEEPLKVTDEVPYPLELNLYEFCSDELKQKLQTYQQGSMGAENAGGISLDGPVESSSADGSSATSMYELVAVVTHDGSTPHLGHYLAWVKQEGGYWIQYNDDIATKHTEEDVLKLCGGGEGQMAYMCMYKSRRQ